MLYNKLRQKLNEGSPTIATRLWSSWPYFVEAVGHTGLYDYVEFLAENVPFSQNDLENLARAAELHDMGTMIKIDFQNRAYVAQKAVASGFQAVLFADHCTPLDVRESISFIKPKAPDSGGEFGYPGRRFIGGRSRVPQTEHISRLMDTVCCFMIEKQDAVEQIDAICSVPGVDMIQFGGSDYSMSMGWDQKDHTDACREAERIVIETALRHGVQPRCEITSVKNAEYYLNLGVRHFCLGDQLSTFISFLKQDGKQLADMLRHI